MLVVDKASASNQGLAVVTYFGGEQKWQRTKIEQT